MALPLKVNQDKVLINHLTILRQPFTILLGMVQHSRLPLPIHSPLHNMLTMRYTLRVKMAITMVIFKKLLLNIN